MIFPSHWFGPGAKLDSALQSRVAAWKALPPTTPQETFAGIRWVVVDTETGGLDVRHDRLIAIGAVTLAGLRIPMADAFDVVLRQAMPSSRENIVVHGIGGAAQRSGEDAPAALIRFLEYCGKSPLIAYHAPFDAAFVKRAMREHLDFDPHLAWLDLAALLPVLFDGPAHAPLDHWLDRFGIAASARHTALGDAFVTAQLAQIIFRRAQARGTWNYKGLASMAANRRWVGH